MSCVNCSMEEISKQDKKELNALISLLDEPSQMMFDKIEQKILSYGTDAVQMLEDKWDSCYDEFIQVRIENMIHKIQFNRTYNEFLKWSSSDNPKLFDGYFLITQYIYPELEKADLLESVRLIINDVRLELSENMTALGKVKVINHILFDIHKFRADRRSLRSIQKHFLNNLLELKKGSDFSIGVLYLIIAEAVGLSLFGVDIPKHFLLCYSDKREVRKAMFSADDIVFFVNPFTKGSILTKNEVELYVQQVNLISNASYYSPLRETGVIKRLISELLIYYNNQGVEERVSELELLLSYLSEI